MFAWQRLDGTSFRAEGVRSPPPACSNRPCARRRRAGSRSPRRSRSTRPATPCSCGAAQTRAAPGPAGSRPGPAWRTVHTPGDRRSPTPRAMPADPQVAVAADGAGLFAWRRAQGSHQWLKVRLRSALGGLGDERTVKRVASPQSLSPPRLSLDADGDAVIAWELFDASANAATAPQPGPGADPVGLLARSDLCRRCHRPARPRSTSRATRVATRWWSGRAPTEAQAASRPRPDPRALFSNRAPTLSGRAELRTHFRPTPEPRIRTYVPLDRALAHCLELIEREIESLAAQITPATPAGWSWSPSSTGARGGAGPAAARPASGSRGAARSRRGRRASTCGWRGRWPSCPRSGRAFAPRRAQLLEGARADAGRRRRQRGRADRARPPRDRRPARAHGARRAAVSRRPRPMRRSARASCAGTGTTTTAAWHRRQAAARGRRAVHARARGARDALTPSEPRRGRDETEPRRFRGTACRHRAGRFRGTAARRLTQQRRVARRVAERGARPPTDRHGGRRALPGPRARRRRDPGHGFAWRECDGTGGVRDRRRAGDRARDRPAPGLRLLATSPSSSAAADRSASAGARARSRRRSAARCRPRRPLSVPGL